MAGTVKKLGAVICLFLVEVIFILVGGYHSPQPTHVVGPAPLVHCLQDQKHPHQLTLPNSCEKVNIASTDDSIVTPDRVVFANIVPYNINHYIIRWFQYMLCFANIRIQFQEDNPVGKEGDPLLTLELRIAYSDHDDAWKHPEMWTEFANSTEVRTLECHFPYEFTKEYEGFEYNCDPIFIFQLSSLPHKRYLINLELPTGLDDPDAPENNRNIGKVVEIEYISIMQTGRFTAVWLGMKTALFFVMVCPVVWFCKRVRSLARKSLLKEKACFVLGISMVFLNLPVEFFAIQFDVPWMLLFTDIRQGLFYAILFSFWVIITGEHLMDQAHRNKLSSYKWHLGCIFTTSLALLSLKLAERGIQLANPFATVWKHSAFGYALLILGGISAALYLVIFGFMIYKVFRSIQYKRPFFLLDERAKQIQSIVERLLLPALATAAVGLSIAFFFLEQKLDGVLNEWFALNIQVASPFFTGVYTLWNIYVFIILFMYAPSHKVYEFSIDDNFKEVPDLAPLQNDTEPTHVLNAAQQKEREHSRCTSGPFDLHGGGRTNQEL